MIYLRIYNTARHFRNETDTGIDFPDFYIRFLRKTNSENNKRYVFLTFPDRRSRWGVRWRSYCGLPRDVPQDASLWSPPVGDAPIRHPCRRNWRWNAHRRRRGSFAGRSSGDRVGDENGASLVLQAEGIRKKVRLG